LDFEFLFDFDHLHSYSGGVLVVHGGESIIGVNLFDFDLLLAAALGCFGLEPIACMFF
jgi:hypothetical protein